MTTFTTIPNSSLEPGKPIRSIDGLALRDNPIAMFEGDASAPKLAAAGLQTGTNERDWVLARTAVAAVGAIGTYALLTSYPAFGSYLPGATAPGSALRYCGTSPSYGAAGPVGTWRCMGYSTVQPDGYGGYLVISGSIWLRIS